MPGSLTSGPAPSQMNSDFGLVFNSICFVGCIFQELSAKHRQINKLAEAVGGMSFRVELFCCCFFFFPSFLIFKFRRDCSLLHKVQVPPRRKHSVFWGHDAWFIQKSVLILG